MDEKAMKIRKVGVARPHQIPTLQEIHNAHQLYEKIMHGDFAYRSAAELVKYGFDNDNPETLALAVTLLLGDWNKGYYQYKHHDALDSKHFARIKQFIESYLSILKDFNPRSLENLANENKSRIQNVFEDFHPIVGAVGTTKALHILAPRFYPLGILILQLITCAGSVMTNKKMPRNTTDLC